MPVSSVTAEAKLAEDGVFKKVATLVPNPVIPSIEAALAYEADPSNEPVNSAIIDCAFILSVTFLKVNSLTVKKDEKFFLNY